MYVQEDTYLHTYINADRYIYVFMLIHLLTSKFTDITYTQTFHICIYAHTHALDIHIGKGVYIVHHILAPSSDCPGILGGREELLYIA